MNSLRKKRKQIKNTGKVEVLEEEINNGNND